MQITEQNILAILADRQEIYGDFRDFCTFTAARWSNVLGHPIRPYQVPLMMAEVKRERLRTSPKHADSILDLAAYRYMADVLIGLKPYPEILTADKR
jgi:hypothetical protein